MTEAKKPPEFDPDDAVNPELVQMAHEWALGAAPDADQAAHTVFVTMLYHLLAKAWRLGHKWVADSDSNLRKKAETFVGSEEALDSAALFDLLKEVEDQAWMRLSEARTKELDRLRTALGENLEKFFPCPTCNRSLDPAQHPGIVINRMAFLRSQILVQEELYESRKKRAPTGLQGSIEWADRQVALGTALIAMKRELEGLEKLGIHNG